MTYIAWDTETSGLPLTRAQPSPSNISKYDTCRIVSLAAVKFSDTGEEIGSFHKIVYPGDFTVGASHIHGITHEHALAHGTPFPQLFREFVDFVGPVHTLVAHNSKFDENVLLSEMIRHSLDVAWYHSVDFRCTLDMHKKIFFDTIKLIKLHEKLFNEGFDGAHDALNDARACGRVYPILRDYKYTHRPIGIPKVVIKASDVSTAVGMSFIKKPKDLLEDLWLKYSPETYTEETLQERAQKVIASCPEAEAIVNNPGVDAFDRVEAVQSLAPADKGLIKTFIRRREYEKGGPAPSLTVTHDGSNFSRIHVCTIEGTRYEIFGKATSTLVKARPKGILGRVRDFEEVQCQTYMAMLGLNSVEFVEEAGDGSRRVHVVGRDDHKFATTMGTVRRFCEYFHHALSTRT